ncbi:unnamed protein product [Rangifer tarandus platyrhynchus]|uniref:Uncharacterized protein n=1 Tax=Rangifer tarandus platyrhynchus TaxID=3082113 RepID=A0ABN8XIB6_RANTA|nr:unnamed protein product [Rangifer tarandus platyrhynchus]
MCTANTSERAFYRLRILLAQRRKNAWNVLRIWGSRRILRSREVRLLTKAYAADALECACGEVSFCSVSGVPCSASLVAVTDVSVEVLQHGKRECILKISAGRRVDVLEKCTSIIPDFRSHNYLTSSLMRYCLRSGYTTSLSVRVASSMCR